MTVGGFFKQWFGGGAQSSLPSRARGPNTPGDDGARAPVGSALEEGVALARAGQHERAATCFLHYLASCPASAVGHLNLGSTLQDQARLEAGAANRRELIEALAREAAREFEAALSCDPGFGGIGRAMALIGLGRMHLVLGEFPVATRVLLTVLELPDVDRATKDAAREALARVHFRETIGEGSIPREDEERRAALFADASRLLEGRLT
jgi:tetratricopeptide (TPR) repeat protein